MELKAVQPGIEAISALIVDDEAPARGRLAKLLAKDPDIGALHEAVNGVAAVAAIREIRPDIVFLDVQMPGLDGFGVIDAIGVENMPLTIFVSAYDQFALRAFEAEAVDYLLKPFGDGRYESTLRRVKARLQDLRSNGSARANSFGPELQKLIAQRSKPGEIWEWVVVKTREGTRLISVDDVDWFEAAGAYVAVHSEGAEFLYRASLSSVEARLDPFRFVRIHRSSIVNIRSVALLERRSHGELEVLLKDGTCLTMSRSHRSKFEAMLGQTL